MGLNITHTMSGYQFENRENLRNAARNILNKQGASEENVKNITEKSVFEANNLYDYSNAQLSILKAASQIDINSTLKETLKYLKSHPIKKAEKEPILGELWNKLSKEEISESDIIELDIDYSANIFAAA